MSSPDGTRADEARSWSSETVARRRRQREEERSESSRDRPEVTRHETSSRDFERRRARSVGWAEAEAGTGREPDRRGSHGQWGNPTFFGASREGRGGSRAETYASEGYGHQQRGVESPSRQRRAFGEGDDHYRSWRDRQLAEYDRDYEAFCRQRQDKFNADFAAWRSQRQAFANLSSPPIEDSSGRTADATMPATPSAESARREAGARRKKS